MSVEVEIEVRRAELEAVSAVFEERARCLEELRLSVEKFQQRYSLEVGQKRIELDRLNEELEGFMARKYSGADDIKSKSFGFEKQAAIVETPVSDLKEMKKLYRKIAAIIHPDKAAEGRCRDFRTDLMAALNDAFARKDSASMLGILEQWRESPEAVAGEGPVAELERVNRAIDRIKRKILEIERESSKISASEMYVMMVKVQDAERAGRDILSEMTAALNAKVEYAKNTLLMRLYG